MKMFIQCYMARRLPRGKERICCKLYNDKQKSEDKTRKVSHISETRLTLSKGKQAKKRKELIERKEISKISKYSKTRKTKRQEMKISSRERLTDKLSKEKAKSELKEQPVVPTIAVRKSEEKESPETLAKDNKCKCQIVKS
ncbi:PREDICTED: uncharacterized protein LOC107068446 [Polistes dominula]|uniref:Uncharacterized protein LOC107068446 n=1 Tax=Polistes dominula TaxID=743375 RepID=A0ABM1IJB4_POLDO|nr:PREDICTED: uncharacterized protein LOC107068446 [Polistes dominula]